MTVLHTGWVLSSGEQINWKEISKLSESSTVALIHPDKTIGSYIKTTEMQDGKVYYYYSSWQKDGTYLYLKKGNQFYKGLKEDGTDKFKEQDIKKEGANYKTEVERTEKLQIKLKNNLDTIVKEIKKDDDINISSISEIMGAIANIKSSRKKWAEGTRGFFDQRYVFWTYVTGADTNMVYLDKTKLNINFTPNHIIIFEADEIRSVYSNEHFLNEKKLTWNEWVKKYLNENKIIIKLYSGGQSSESPVVISSGWKWIAFE